MCMAGEEEFLDLKYGWGLMIRFLLQSLRIGLKDRYLRYIVGMIMIDLDHYLSVATGLFHHRYPAHSML